MGFEIRHTAVRYFRKGGILAMEPSRMKSGFVHLLEAILKNAESKHFVVVFSL